MTTIEAPALYELVAAPASVPRRFGVFSVLDFADDGTDVELGLTWESLACSLAGLTYNPCVDPSVLALVSEQCNTYGEADPFAVYSHNTDSIAGRPMTEHEAAVRARLLAGEEYGVEQWVATYLASIDTPTAAFATGADAMSAATIALATAEQAASGITNTERIVWTDTRTATILFAAGAIAREGALLRTALGSRVAVLAADLDDVIYATGPFKAHRGGVEMLAGNPDTDRNNVSIIAQRVYVLGTACGAASSTIVYPA